MANFDNIIQEINTNLPDNNTQAITAVKMRTTLIDAVNDVNTKKQDTLTFDSTPTENGTNPVTSGGIYTATKFESGQKVSEVSIINNLSTGGITDVLSAEQGKRLNGVVNIQNSETPAYTVTSGYYISNLGVLKNDQQLYNMTSAFEIHKGDKVTFVGRANGNMACIAETDINQTSYIPRVVGTTTGEVRTYTYTFSNDCYCVISYYQLSSISLQPSNSIGLLQIDVQQLKNNEQNYQLKSSLVTSVNSESTDDTYPSSKAVYDFANAANQVGTKLLPYLGEFDKLKILSQFNGESSYATTNGVTLQNEGDELEIEVFPEPMPSGDHNYSLGQQNYTYNTRLGLTQTHFNVRANDTTWIALNIPIGGTKTHYVFKIKFEDGNIKMYVDDVLKRTYTGQKTITINRWGWYTNGAVNAYWKGKIGYIKVNDVTYGNFTQLPGYTGHTITNETSNVFLTDEQAEKLDAVINYPRCVVSYYPTGGVHSIGIFYTYVRYDETDIYFRLDLTHLKDDSDAEYYNLWRIRTNGGLFRYNADGTFTNLNKDILIGSENEFAFAYQGASDHTGGYHGDERIDTEGCFAKFFIDGIEVTTEQMQEQFIVECESFYMLQRSSLHETKPSGGSVNPNHPIIAYHIKKTEFCDNGFTCTNRLNIDLTNSTLDSITTISLYSGLICVNKNCATNTYLDDGIIRDTSAGDESGVNYSSGITGKVCFFNQNTGLSCVVDSYEISLENCLNKTIRIADRVGDTKYYRYMTNRTFVTGDKYMCVSKAKWNYKE